MKNFYKFLIYCFGYYYSRLIKGDKLPENINFPINNVCNAKCVMCDVWKENDYDELSIEDLNHLSESGFLKNLKHVGLSGGEPFLRKDIDKIVNSLINNPKIKSLSITSHGFNTERIKQKIPIIVDSCKKSNVKFRINFSLDGINELHDQIRGVKGGFTKLVNSINFCQKIGCEIELQCTVTKRNVYNLIEIQHWARENECNIIYRLGTSIERLDNLKTMKNEMLSKNMCSYFSDFLLSPLTLKLTKNPTKRLFYKSLANMIVNDVPRSAPCVYKMNGAYLSSNGDIYQCSISKQKITDTIKIISAGTNFYSNKENLNERFEFIKNTCSSCYHDQSGSWSPIQILKEEIQNRTMLADKIKKIFEIFEWVILIVYAYFLSKINKKKLLINKENNSGLIIGCYGGEHVGDAAILGGVLNRLNKEISCSNFTVVSSRPDRTKRWVSSIKNNYEVNVINYSKTPLLKNLSNCSHVVLGGGPLMELKIILLRHLAVFVLAKIFGKKIIIEGVGFGPFKSKFFEFIARMILSIAKTVSVRDENSQRKLQKYGIISELVRDPAFDYLEQLNATNLQIDSKSKSKIIGLNIRPLWDRYSFKNTSIQRIENLVFNKIAEYINSNPDKEFIFFPMNADTYGMSDLVSGLKIKSLVNKSNFKIWFNEPDIDELIVFMKSCEKIISMRFHGCIFGITASIPTTGIDYGIGRVSKVKHLYNDLGIEDDCLLCLSESEISQWKII